MQLRKVCNHPDLFEPRPVTSPLQLPALRLDAPALVLTVGAARVARLALAARLGGDLAALELAGAEAFAAHRARHLAPPRRALEELDPASPCSPPAPPPAPLRLHLRLVPRAPPAAAPPPPAAALVAAVQPPAPAPARRGSAAPRTPAGGARVTPDVAPTRTRSRLESRRRAALRRLAACNERRCWRLPLYGADLLAAAGAGSPAIPPRQLSDQLSELHDLIDK